MTSLKIEFQKKAGIRYGKAKVEGIGFHQLIENAESIALSDSDIMKICDNKVVIHLYEDLAKFQTIDQALSEHGAMIILYQAKQDFGHWISVFKVDNNTLELFDSYGFKLDQELPFFEYNLRQGVPHLTHLIQNSNYKVISNDIDFQTIRKDSNTCGRYSSLRVKMRSTDLKSFQALLLNNPNDDPDFYVSSLTIIYSF
jgi:hypothetical protein